MIVDGLKKGWNVELWQCDKLGPRLEARHHDDSSAKSVEKWQQANVDFLIRICCVLVVRAARLKELRNVSANVVVGEHYILWQPCKSNQ